MRRDFCWSCGTMIGPPTGGPCPACGTGRDAPAAPDDSIVGVAVSFRAGLGKHSGIVVDESGGDVLVLTDRKESRTVPLSRVTPVGEPAGRSGAYRLHAAGHNEYANSALRSLGARRAFAVDAIEADDLGALQSSGLSSTEQMWLTMWAAQHRGRRTDAVAAALSLPVGGYPDKLVVLLQNCGEWYGAPAAVEHIRNQLRSLPRDATGHVIEFLVSDSPDLASLSEAVVHLESGATGIDWGNADVRATTVFGGEGDMSALIAAARAVDTPAGRSLALVEDPEGRPPSDLTGLTLQVLEEAHERGSLRREHLNSPTATAWAEDSALRALLGRMSPEQRSDEELLAAGDSEELRRRVFLGQIDAQLAPSDTPWARRYELLDSLRSGNPRVLGELVPLLPERHQKTALALGRSLIQNTIEADAAADRTTWPTLRDLAASFDGDLDVAPEVRDMAGWVLLEDAIDALYDWRWDDARRLAQLCHDLVDDEPRRDEALCVQAAVAWMTEADHTAERLLDLAVEGDASASLLVNYSLVAQFVDPSASIDALERLIKESTDGPLRRNAAIVAAERLRELDGGETTPPRRVVDVLRAGAVQETTLEEHGRILSLLAWADEDWLKHARNTAASPHAAATSHRIAVARADGPAALMTLLAAELPRHPDDPELLAQRDWLADMVIDVTLESEEPAPWAGFLGLDLVKRGVPLEPRQRVLVPVLSVRECLFHAGSLDEIPVMPPDMYARLEEADEYLRRSESEFDDPGPFRELVAATYELWANIALVEWAGRAQAIFEHFNDLIDQYNSILAGLSYENELYRLQADLRGHFTELLPLVEELRSDIRTVLRRVPHDSDAAGRLQDLLDDLGPLATRLRRGDL